MPIYTIHCPNCGYDGDAKPTQSGSCLLEAVLWLLLVIPGVIYSFWRAGNPRLVCPRCSNPYPARLAKRYATSDWVAAAVLGAVLLAVGLGFASCVVGWGAR